MRNENLNLIISESNRMSEMVNDILDYSQFSAGYSSLKKEWCDLRDIVTAELTRCRQAAAEHGITLTLLVTEETSDRRSSASAADVQSSRPFFFEVDALKMSQVMRNLLNNAINHTPENQEIRICLTPQPAARFQELAGAPIPTGNTASFTGDTSAEAAFSASCCLVEVINPGEPLRQKPRNPDLQRGPGDHLGALPAQPAPERAQARDRHRTFHCQHDPKGTSDAVRSGLPKWL
mgnify:CR=1 FL=1